MIAGPATITAAVSFPSQFGTQSTIIGILLGVSINLGVMLIAPQLSKVLSRYNIMGALIRITGLIVATIGIQMLLNGFSEYIRSF